MKPVEKYSIGGYLFSVEEDALGKVNEYLGELDSYYSKQDSGSEIMDGIEERLGELLLERCGQNGVVTDADVQGVIEILGRPEAIEKESSEEDSAHPSTQSYCYETGKGPRKRLYRDTENARIGGVCSGLGAFFKLDPIIFRLAFVFLTLALFGIFNNHSIFQDVGWLSWFFPFLYVVLWIFLPPARTVRQKDQMHGNDGTVDGISKRIKTEKANTGDSTATDVWPKVARIILACLGIIFIIVGVCGITAVSTFLARTGFYDSGYLYNRFLEYAEDISPYLIGCFSSTAWLLLAALVVYIPLVLILYSGILMAFNLKSPKWHPGLILLILWFASVTALAVYTSVQFIP
jgi:phage shock protein PspC (stress-responsive transcriptional regulator)